MKKLVKNLFLLGCLIDFLNFINKLIFKRAFDYFKNKNANLNFYKSIHGKINYTVCGSGEPVLLIHGIYPGAGSYEWENTKKYLSEKHRVYTIDLLGFGFSDKPNLSYSSYLYISLINDFIKNVIKKRTSVIASGLAADYTVMAYNFSSDNFNKIVLISPKGIDDNISQVSSLNIFIEMIINLPVIGTTIYNMMTSKLCMTLFIKYNFFSSYYRISDNFIMEYYYMAHYGGVSSKYPISSFISGLLNIDIKSHIAKVKIPMIIISEDKKILNFVKSNNYIVENFKNINYIKFSNCKTMPHIENYKKFNTICNDFFS